MVETLRERPVFIQMGPGVAEQDGELDAVEEGHWGGPITPHVEMVHVVKSAIHSSRPAV